MATNHIVGYQELKDLCCTLDNFENMRIPAEALHRMTVLEAAGTDDTHGQVRNCDRCFSGRIFGKMNVIDGIRLIRLVGMRGLSAEESRGFDACCGFGNVSAN